MLQLLNQYGGISFLKKVLTAWHEAVVEERDIRHYFINVTPDILMKDQINYMSFIMRQPDRVYRESPFQSAPLDVQVSASVFDEVMIVLRKVLTEMGVHRDLVPRISTHIIEIVEESRAQAEDIAITTWKPVDITPDNLLRFYNKQRGDARLEANNDIYATRGYAYPFWTRILRETQQLMFFASADLQEWSHMDELKKVVAQANEKVPTLKFEAVVATPLPQFTSQYTVPYQNGVPTRLFLRAARQFATFFENGMAVDKKREVLRSALS
ncbi:MAG: hypothetical protein EBQ82_11585 [Betaproteobacteria bacterium]|nr:hypothetical protein [Betaproteobacteria bacterium]NBY06002.1 hypothetical protein [Betaproteobacteria bacterium]